MAQAFAESPRWETLRGIKWVAKLRAMKTDNNKLYLYTNMDAGHGGASGRFKRLKEVELEYTFVFDILGMKEVIETQPKIEAR